MIALIGMVSKADTTTPINPDNNPIMSVSAINTKEILPLDAPILRKIPISLVRSSTEILVIMAIIIHETTSDTATKAMRTYDMISTICVMDEVSNAM